LKKIGYENFPKEWSHVLSFSRRLVMQIIDPKLIPESIDVNDESGKVYKVYLEHGPRKCHKCGSLKHIASKCKPQVVQKTQNNTQPNVPAPSRIMQVQQELQGMVNGATESDPGTKSDSFTTVRKKKSHKRVRHSSKSPLKNAWSGVLPPSINTAPFPFATTMPNLDLDNLFGKTPEVLEDSQKSPHNTSDMDEDITPNQSIFPHTKLHSQTVSPKIRIDVTKLSSVGPIDNIVMLQLIEEFTAKKSFEESAYSGIVQKYKIKPNQLHQMLSALKMEIPTKDHCYQLITAMLNKWPSTWRSGNAVKSSK